MLVNIIIITSCTTNQRVGVTGININSISTSLGACEGQQEDQESQSFKYSVTLTNSEKCDIKIMSITPIISESIFDRVLTEDLTVSVNKIIGSGKSINISGEIVLDVKGLSKGQLISLKPFVKKVTVNEERIIQTSF